MELHRTETTKASNNKIGLRVNVIVSLYDCTRWLLSQNKGAYCSMLEAMEGEQPESEQPPCEQSEGEQPEGEQSVCG